MPHDTDRVQLGSGGDIADDAAVARADGLDCAPAAESRDELDLTGFLAGGDAQVDVAAGEAACAAVLTVPNQSNTPMAVCY